MEAPEQVEVYEPSTMVVHKIVGELTSIDGPKDEEIDAAAMEPFVVTPSGEEVTIYIAEEVKQPEESTAVPPIPNPTTEEIANFIVRELDEPVKVGPGPGELPDEFFANPPATMRELDESNEDLPTSPPPEFFADPPAVVRDLEEVSAEPEGAQPLEAVRVEPEPVVEIPVPLEMSKFVKDAVESALTKMAQVKAPPKRKILADLIQAYQAAQKPEEPHPLEAMVQQIFEAQMQAGKKWMEMDALVSLPEATPQLLEVCLRNISLHYDLPMSIIRYEGRLRVVWELPPVEVIE